MKIKFLIPLAGLVLFCACKGRGTSADSADTVRNDLKNDKAVETTKTADETFKTEQKLVKTAAIRFKVKNVEQTSDQVAGLTAACNGTVMYHTITSVTGDSTTIRKTDDSLLKITVINTTANMTVKIPPAKVETFISQVAQMGLVVNNLKIEITDKTFEYLATRMKLKNQHERIGEGGDLKDPDHLLSYKNDITDEQIKNLKTNDSVKNAVIVLNFYESNVVHKELVANPDLSEYRLPVLTRLGFSIKNGWGVFMDIMVELANLWILAPIAAVVWVIVRYFNKRRKPAGIANS